MSPTWEASQIDKHLRRRSEELAHGVLEADLPEQLTIEWIANHYQRSRDEIERRMKPANLRHAE